MSEGEFKRAEVDSIVLTWDEHLKQNNYCAVVFCPCCQKEIAVIINRTLEKREELN